MSGGAQLPGPGLDFERLLGLFGSEREAAAVEYEAVRRRLVRFFAWRDCPAPEECVDLTLDRVARKLAEGQLVGEGQGVRYVFGVARYVAREAQAGRTPASRLAPLGAAHEFMSPPGDGDGTERERRLAALDTCLERLPAEARGLILRYYVGEQRVRIDERRGLAATLGLSPRALRLRVHRLRQQLERCLLASLAEPK